MNKQLLFQILSSKNKEPEKTINTIRIDMKTTDDPDRMISGDINDNIIRWIRDNTHRYLGKYTSANTMTLCQLDDNNSNYFYDGTVATLDGTQGDVFVKHPTFYTNAVEVSDGIYDISFAKEQVNDNWIEWDGNDIIGAYEASSTTTFDGNVLETENSNEGYLRSISGVDSISSVTKENLSSKATNRSNSFSLVRWEHCNIMAILFYAIYGHTNSQRQCGDGTDNSNKYTGLTNSLGMRDTDYISGHSSDINNPKSINFFGLENWWGNKPEYVDNISLNHYTYTITDKYTGTVRYVYAECTPASQVYPKRFTLGAMLDHLPYSNETEIQTGGDSSHGFCDACYVHRDDERVIAHCSHNSFQSDGVSYVNGIGSPNTRSLTSSRLAFKGNCIIVDKNTFNNSIAIQDL